MSKTAAPQKPNFLSNLLLMFAIVMGIQLLCNRPQPQQQLTLDQLHRALVEQNAHRLDVTITQTQSQYENALDQAVKEKKLTLQDAETKKIEATILVADTQFRAGLHANDTNRIRSAFYSLAQDQRKLLNQPQWNALYQMPPDVSGDPKLSFPTWSGQQLYEQVRDTLATRNRTDLVWGFIPGYQVIDALVALTGRVSSFSYAFAAFLLAFMVRAIVFPLSQRQIMYGRQMSQLTPLVKEIKDKYAGDQMVQQQKTMELYKEYGVNPLAGCAPMLVQLPFFFAIYQCMVHYQFTFEKGTFLWINPATSVSTHGFVAANLGQMDYILTIIYGISMVVSSLLTPISDPSQWKQQRLMGAGMSVMVTLFMFSGKIPVVSGFVLYWTFTNMLATAQSLRAYRLPLPPLVKVNAKGGGVYPQSRVGGKWAKWFEEMQTQAMQQQDPSKKNGSAGNGKASNGNPGTFLGSGETKTGTPAKHKPKKRK